jgi:hypothetical protein
MYGKLICNIYAILCWQNFILVKSGWWCKRLGGKESEGEGVGSDGERQDPFIVVREGHARARKGEMTCGNGLNAIEGGAA